MKRKISKLFIGILAAGIISSSAYAGEINSAEQQILDAASQSFEYNGTTYVIKGTYIDKGTSKLASDDMDLSDAEAKAYAAQISSSRAELVEQGYCKEVSGSDATPDPATTPVPTSSPKKAKQNKEFLKKIFGTPDKNDGTSTDNKNEQDNQNNTAEATPVPTEAAPTPTPIVWDEEQNLGTSIDFTEKDINNAKEGTLKIGNGKADKSVYTADNKENTVSDILHIGILKILMCVIIVLSVIAVGLSVYYNVNVKKQKKKDRKLRRGIAIYDGIVIGCFTALILVTLGLNSGVYSKSIIHRQMMQSDYFSGVAQMTRNLVSEQLTAAGYDAQIAEDVFSLSNVYIDGKQYVDAVLTKDDAQIDVTAIHKELTERITLGSEEDNQKLITQVEDTYKGVLRFDFGTVLKQSKDSFKVIFYVSLIAGLIVIVALTVLMEKMYGFLHKSVRVTAFGILAASIVITVASFAGKLRFRGMKLVANPAYYQQFLQKYISWDINVMLYIGIIGILLSIGLFVWKKHLHKVYVE